jgi:hypothetical protein
VLVAEGLVSRKIEDEAGAKIDYHQKSATAWISIQIYMGGPLARVFGWSACDWSLSVINELLSDTKEKVCCCVAAGIINHLGTSLQQVARRCFTEKPSKNFNRFDFTGKQILFSEHKRLSPSKGHALHLESVYRCNGHTKESFRDPLRVCALRLKRLSSNVKQPAEQHNRYFLWNFWCI